MRQTGKQSKVARQEVLSADASCVRSLQPGDGREAAGHQVHLSASARKDLRAESITSALTLEDLYFHIRSERLALTTV